MKNPQDPRHKKRERIVRDIFSWEFQKTSPNPSSLVGRIVSNVNTIDITIEKAAPQYPLKTMSKIDLAILRLAVYEMIILKKTPPKVIMDEAVELSKTYGGESSPGFINGVLGSIYETTKI